MFEEVKVLTHSSIKISGEKVLYFDPFQVAQEFRDADMIFVTHDHFDHFSPEDIVKVEKEETVLVLPESMKEAAGKVLCDLSKCRFVKPGDTLKEGGVTVEAVAAYNRLKPFHPKGKQYVGYLVTMNGVTYYVAGDTDVTPENEQLKCDVALVPVGGKFTMDHKDAAKLVNRMMPRLAIPTHYGNIAGSPDSGKKFAELVDGGIEVRIQI